MPVNKVPAIWTLAHVATQLGLDEDWLFGVVGEMGPEDGVIWVYGPPLSEDGTVAFTDFGIENLKNLIDIYKAGQS
jgi:hypothetical protein